MNADNVLLEVNSTLDRAGVPNFINLSDRIRWIISELNMLKAMKEGLDRVVAENSEGDPTELARRVIDSNNDGPIAYALAKQVRRDHHHTLQLIAKINQLESCKP